MPALQLYECVRYEHIRTFAKIVSLKLFVI
jgi:hypothetical protein